MRNDVLNQILENIGGEKLPTDSNDRNRILSAINVQLGGEPFPLDAQRNDILRAINNSFGGETQPEFTARREFLLAIEKATHVDGVEFESYSEDSILAAIEFNTREGGLANWTPDYKGAGYITIEPWHGVAGDTIEMTVVPTKLGVYQYMVDSTDKLNRHYLQIGANDRFSCNFATIETTGAIELDKEITITATATVDFAVDLIATNNAHREQFNGSITDIYLTNQDGSDNRHYPSTIRADKKPTTLFLENKLAKFSPDEWSVDYADTGYVQLRKPWVASAGDTITCDVIFGSNTGDYQHIFDGFTSSNRLIVATDRGNTWFLTGCNLKVNGVSVVHGDKIPAVGTSASLELSSLTGEVGRIGSRYTGDYVWNGNITNIHFNSETDPRHYPSIIKSPTQPQTDVLEEVLGEYSSKDWTVEFAGTGYVKLDKPWVCEVGGKIKLKFTFANTGGAWEYLFESTGKPRLYLAATSTLTWGDNATVKLDGVVASKPFALVVGKTYELELSCVEAFTAASWGANSGGAENWSGAIRDIKFYAPDGTLERHYPSLINSDTKPNTLVLDDVLNADYGKRRVNYKGNGYVTIPEWTAESGDTITCDVTRTGSSTGWVRVFGGSNDINVAVKPDNTCIFSGCSIKVNGVLVLSGGTVPDIGTGFKLEVFNILKNVTTVGARSNGSDRWIGSITNLRMNSTNPDNCREYADIIDGEGGLVLEDKLAENVVINGGFDTDLSNWSTSGWWVWSKDRAYHPRGSDYKGLRQTFTEDLPIGSVVTFDAEILSGTAVVVCGNQVIISNGKNEVVVSKLAPFIEFKRLDADTEFYIDNVSITVTHGTLTGFPVGQEWTTLSDTAGTLTGFVAGTEWDNSLSNHGTLVGFGYEELPPPSSSRMGYYNSSTLTYSKDKPPQQQTDKTARSQYMTLYREKKVYDGWTNKMGKHGVMNGFAVGEGWKEV